MQGTFVQSEAPWQEPGFYLKGNEELLKYPSGGLVHIPPQPSLSFLFSSKVSVAPGSVLLTETLSIAWTITFLFG